MQQCRPDRCDTSFPVKNLAFVYNVAGFRKYRLASLDRLQESRAFQVSRSHFGVAIHPVYQHKCSKHTNMARGKPGKKGGKSTAPKAAPKVNGKDASINRINTFEDTLEEGGVDECEYSGYAEARSSLH